MTGKNLSTIIFMRHSDPVIDKNVPPANWELSVEGKKKIEKLVPYLPKPDLVFTSPELKAMQTAQTVSSYFDLELLIDENLKEVAPPTDFLPFDDFVVYKNGGLVI